MSKELSILERDDSKHKFIKVCQSIRKVDAETAGQVYEVEKFSFLRTVSENDALNGCTEISKLGTFIGVISNGLSFDNSANHIYLIPRGNKLGYTHTADGLIYLTTRSGAIKNCTRPVLVYEGDQIEVKTVDDRTTINHEISVPRKSSKILGGYCFITMSNDDRQAFWMGVEEVDRLKKYSEKANRGKANALYTGGDDSQIDSGFFATKIIRAALKNINRLPVGNENYIDDLDEIIDTPEYF